MCELLLQSPHTVRWHNWGGKLSHGQKGGLPTKADSRSRHSSGELREFSVSGLFRGAKRVGRGVRGILLELPSGCSIGILFNNSLSPKIVRVDSIINS